MKTQSNVAVMVSILFLCLLMSGPAYAVGYSLTVGAQGSGTVTPDNTSNPHPPGVNINITATPDAGWYFANWSGDASGSANPLLVTMNSNLSITGNFLPYPTYTLTLATNGQGTIALNPAGGSYYSNTIIMATATPTAGWVFAGWSGVTNSSANPVSFALNSNGSLTGTFAQLPAIDADPVSVTNVAGSTVNFSAHAVGTAPVNYRWFFSAGTLTGQTNTTLTLTNVGPGQVGNYWMVATNIYGSATSQMASLTLTNSTGPTNLVNSPNETALRAAIAMGGWVGLRFNGTVTLTNTINITNNVILDGTSFGATISGGKAVRIFYVANGASLTLSNLTLANGYCLVSNGVPGTPADAGGIYNDGGAVTVSGCTLTNNSAQSLISGGLARGGAVFNNGGTVVFYQSTFVSNTAVGGAFTGSTFGTTGIGFGGAIFNTNGTMTIKSCAVTGNTSRNTSDFQGYGLTMGGAVFQGSGTMTISNSSFSGNQAVGGAGASGLGGAMPGSPANGGALAILGGNLSIDRSLFLTNQAVGGSENSSGIAGPANGGAIFSTATWSANDSSFAANQIQAGNNSTDSSGQPGVGGGIYNSGNLILNRCSLYLNRVQGGTVGTTGNGDVVGGDGYGGGVFNGGQLTATNCTIALNSAVGASAHHGAFSTGKTITGSAIGAGLYNYLNATSVLMNVTLANNSCSSPVIGSSTYGFASGSQLGNTGGTIRLHNCLIAYGNTNTSYGPLTDDGYNICSDSSAGLASGLSYNSTDPKLAALGDYGGPTLSIALLANSPAIDFGDSAGAPNTDQRGFVRPIGDAPDMGAFEYGSASVATPYLYMTTGTTNVLLSFPAFPSATYYLQLSTNLITWINLSTNGPFASQTNITQDISRQGAGGNFFRLLMQ